MADNRRITVGAVGYKPDVVMQPGDVWAIVFDFAAWQTIPTALITTVIDPVFDPVPDAPTAATPTIVESGKAVRMLVTGGGDGYFGIMTFRAEWDNGEVKEVEAQFAITDIHKPG